jgi:hypothetical protein
MKRIATVLSTIAFAALWVILLGGHSDAAIAAASGEDIVQYPNNSCLYRGVVVGKFIWTGYETDNQTICDFGSFGVWLWDSGEWTQLSSANPDRIIATYGFLYGGGCVIGDFGTMGLWHWTYMGWIQLSGRNPSYIFTVDDNGDGATDLHAAFPGVGLWRMDGYTGEWTALAAASPLTGLATDFWVQGLREGVHSFGPSGVWYFYIETQGGSSSVKSGQLSAATAWDDHVAADFGAGDGSTNLVMDFGPLGTWLAEDETAFPVAWHQLIGIGPLRAREVTFAESGNFDCELLCAFDSAAMSGLWYWNYAGFPGTWTNLANTQPGPGFCEPFNADGASIGGDADDELACDFEGLGLWLFNFQDGSWVQLSPVNPAFMVGVDLTGNGVANSLVVDFGSGFGLWCYDGLAKNWFQLSSLSPDESFDSD